MKNENNEKRIGDAQSDTAAFYEVAYANEGFGAQRRYPNEELMRFLGRRYFSTPHDLRSSVSILDVGCGSGANLWPIAREGFDAYGVDISQHGLALCKEMLSSFAVGATLRVASMCELPFDDGSLSAVVDVFSSNCLTTKEHLKFISEVCRVLKPGGRFFSYHPSKASDAFIDFAPADKLDNDTLDGIRRPTAPFFGNFYPFRFLTTREYAAELEASNLKVTYLETVGRTYRNGSEYFEFVTIEGESFGYI